MNEEVLHVTQFEYKTMPFSFISVSYVLSTPFSITCQGSKRIESIVAIYFNRLPREIREIQDTNSFLRNVKNHMMTPSSISRLLKVWMYNAFCTGYDRTGHHR